MARGRMINTTVREDKRLNELSAEAALVYLMTIPHLDRDGIITGDAWMLFCDVCPLRRGLASKIDDIVAEWQRAGLVVLYDTDNGPALWFCGFAKNQQGMHYTREAPSKFPPPPNMFRTDSGIEISHDVEFDKPNPDELLTNSGPTPAEVKDQDQEQIEDQGEVESSSAPPPATQDRKTPTEQQEYFQAICDAIGWDHKTLTKEASGRVAQTMGVLKKADYAIEDVRRFMVDIWFQDFRWTEKGQRPSLNVLRNEIGKLRAPIPVDLPLNGHDKPTGAAAVRALRARMEAENNGPSIRT